MTRILQYWHFDPAGLLIAVLLIVFHLIFNRKVKSSQHIAYLFAIELVLIVTCSPLGYLAHDYLFSAHMTEHIVLLLIVPPLLLSGTHSNFFKKLKNSRFKKTGDLIFSMPFAWSMGMGAMYFWHIPAIFRVMKESLLLHSIQTLSLVVLGIIFIWPVYVPLNWKKLSPLQSVLYLFISCVGCTVLGILIAFAPMEVYPQFFNGSGIEIWQYINNAGITAALDQRLGGLIMWVPACLIYVTNSMIILFKFFRTDEDQYEYARKLENYQEI